MVKKTTSLLTLALLAATNLMAEEGPKKVTFSYSEAAGIGKEKGVMRRDPSDIIKVGDLFYVWYTKGKVFHGYDSTIWHATSPDGHSWTEKGESLARGPVGNWDEQSVFTPSILVAKGRYFLFFTAVPKPFSNDQKALTPTAIGVAISDSPNGPWEKQPDPVLLTSEDHDQFDSARVDDACMITREGKYWMYYKGRQWRRSPRETKMGVAIAESPEGPYVKYAGNPVIMGNHEVLVWPQGEGVAALIGMAESEDLRHTIQYAEDGLHFSKAHDVSKLPGAPGAYRPEAFTESGKGEPIKWGISLVNGGGQNGILPFLRRFDLEDE